MKRNFIALLLTLVLILCSTVGYAYEIGDIVQFGRYPQVELSTREQMNITLGKKTMPTEPISWIVLDVKNDILLLLSEKVITKAFSSEWDCEAPWLKSGMPEWLNGEMLQYLTKSERTAIVERYKKDTDSMDWFFLLNADEVEKYLINSSVNSEHTLAVSTDYAFFVRGVTYNLKDKTTNWWLRSADGTPTAVLNGKIAGKNHGFSSIYSGIGVRPAVWVSSTSLFALNLLD